MHNLGSSRSYVGEPGSSVSTVSGYGLDDQAMKSIPGTGERIFTVASCVQTSSGAHPAFCTVGIRGPFPRAKAWSECDADHSLPSSAEVKNE
jgi:hypothetical protein